MTRKLTVEQSEGEEAALRGQLHHTCEVGYSLLGI